MRSEYYLRVLLPSLVLAASASLLSDSLLAAQQYKTIRPFHCFDCNIMTVNFHVDDQRWFGEIVTVVLPQLRCAANLFTSEPILPQRKDSASCRIEILSRT